MADHSPPWPTTQLLILLLFLTAAIAAEVDEGQALLDFKQSLSSGGGQALATWINVPGSNPCAQKWIGVRCDHNDKVLLLQLENMSLSGTLNFNALARLPNLRSLSLQNNNFEGGMPNITKLPNLKNIFLSLNRFTGEIPDGMFSTMRGLQIVSLSQNNFSGPIPSSLTKPMKLTTLLLDYNRFEGQIPDGWLSSPRMVIVAYNNLTGPIPSKLSNMSANWFAGNNLCGPPLTAVCLTPTLTTEKKKLSPALLIGIILISVAVLLAVVGLLIFFLRRKKRPPTSRTTSTTVNRFQSSSNTHRIKHLDEDRSELGTMEYHEGDQKEVPKADQYQDKLSFVADLRRENFDLHDLLRASAEVLGSGNFGSSYKAILLNGPAVVVKKFKGMNGVGAEDFQEHMRRLGRLSHPNLLPFLAYYCRKEEKLLITDYIPTGSLAHMLHGNRAATRLPQLDWPTRLKIIKGVARGLAYLYEELPMLTVPHGHLKSSNVLLDLAFEPILTDYGLAPVMNKSLASQVMVAYKSPECARHGKPSKKSDVWSLGILILEILTGKFPANHLTQGRAGTDLASWVNSVVREEWTGEVFDNNMKGTKNGEGEMLKLLQIGMGCCETDVDKRWDLEAAFEKIVELKERESDAEYSSMTSEGEAYSSKVITEDDELSFSK